MFIARFYIILNFIILINAEVKDKYPEGRLFFIVGSEKCRFPNAFTCSEIRLNLAMIHRARVFIEDPATFGKLHFEKVLEYSIMHSYLIEYQAEYENGTKADGYIVLAVNNQANIYYGFLEYQNLRFNFHRTVLTGAGLLTRWFPTCWECAQGRKSKELKDEIGVIPDFPYYYHAIKWFYDLNPQFSDGYKWRLFKGVKENHTVDVSVTFLFTGRTFHSIGTSSSHTLQMIGVYFIKLFNEVMKTSGIRIKWVLHCIEFARENNLNITTQDSYGQTIELNAENDLNRLLDYYNIYGFYTYTYSADVTILFRDDIGSRSGLVKDWGLEKGHTTVFIRQEYAFRKFDLLHEIGHMIGCSHEINGDELLYRPPAIFYAQSYVLPDGHCGIMSDPVHRNCTVSPFFSNPLVKYNGYPSGEYYANNAMWIDHNRYSLKGPGDEKVNCTSDYLMNPKIIDCFLNSRSPFINCNSSLPIWMRN